MKIDGKSIPHESAEGHVTGAALYSDDLPIRFPRVLFAWPVLASHPHAAILSLDLQPALSRSGSRHHVIGVRRYRRE